MPLDLEIIYMKVFKSNKLNHKHDFTSELSTEGIHVDICQFKNVNLSILCSVKISRVNEFLPIFLISQLPVSEMYMLFLNVNFNMFSFNFNFKIEKQ